MEFYGKVGINLGLLPQACSHSPVLLNDELQIVCGWVDGQIPPKYGTDYPPSLHILDGYLPAGDRGEFLPCHEETHFH